MTPTEEKATPALTDFQKYEQSVSKGEQPEIAEPKPAKAVPSGEGEKPSETPAAESETVEQTADTTEEKKTSKRGQEKRIDQLTREKYELRAEIERLKASSAKPETVTPSAATTTADDTPKEPNFDEFATFADYQRALAKYIKEQTAFEVRQARRQDAEAQATAEKQKAEREAAETWDSRVEMARADHDDFDAVALDNKLPVTPIMAALLRESEHGADILYHLGKNHSDAERISGLKPAGQAIALVRLEAKLFPETAETAKPAAVTVKTPPPPPKTIKGVSADPDAMPDPKDFVAYERWSKRQERQKRRDKGIED